mmetsp:Transcript_26907/g.46365  ORF Transcript_26907/g.46365 Transcript_26907/m.46365 type:complete len:210 (-) Transcript_26907:146-775(-)
MAGRHVRASRPVYCLGLCLAAMLAPRRADYMLRLSTSSAMRHLVQGGRHDAEAGWRALHEGAGISRVAHGVGVLHCVPCAVSTPPCTSDCSRHASVASRFEWAQGRQARGITVLLYCIQHGRGRLLAAAYDAIYLCLHVSSSLTSRPLYPVRVAFLRCASHAQQQTSLAQQTMHIILYSCTGKLVTYVVIISPPYHRQRRGGISRHGST